MAACLRHFMGAPRTRVFVSHSPAAASARALGCERALNVNDEFFPLRCFVSLHVPVGVEGVARRRRAGRVVAREEVEVHADGGGAVGGGKNIFQTLVGPLLPVVLVSGLLEGALLRMLWAS